MTQGWKTTLFRAGLLASVLLLIAMTQLQIVESVLSLWRGNPSTAEFQSQTEYYLQQRDECFAVVEKITREEYPARCAALPVLKGLPREQAERNAWEFGLCAALFVLCASLTTYAGVREWNRSKPSLQRRS